MKQLTKSITNIKEYQDKMKDREEREQNGTHLRLLFYPIPSNEFERFIFESYCVKYFSRVHSE